ncbi:hypothetical protein RJ639_024900, partial [Escallonia herrerae]
MGLIEGGGSTAWTYEGKMVVVPSPTTSSASSWPIEPIGVPIAGNYFSLQDLAAESYDYAYVHVMAASDYLNACHNAFK